MNDFFKPRKKKAKVAPPAEAEAAPPAEAAPAPAPTPAAAPPKPKKPLAPIFAPKKRAAAKTPTVVVVESDEDDAEDEPEAPPPKRARKPAAEDEAEQPEAEHESAMEQRRPAESFGATPPNALRDDGKAASDDGGDEILFGSFTSGSDTLPSGRTFTSAERSFSRHTITSSTSSAPIV